MTPANHGPSCRTCQGTGWQPGPPILETIEGRPHPYTTVTPCRRDWWHDEPDYEQPLPAGDPRAEAALAKGYAEGLAERDANRPAAKGAA